MKRLSVILTVLFVLSCSVVLAQAQEGKKSMNDFEVGDKVWVNYGDNFWDCADENEHFSKKCFGDDGVFIKAIILEKRKAKNNENGILYEYKVGLIGFSRWRLWTIKEAFLLYKDEWTNNGIPSQNILIYNL